MLPDATERSGQHVYFLPTVYSAGKYYIFHSLYSGLRKMSEDVLVIKAKGIPGLVSFLPNQVKTVAYHFFCGIRGF